MIRLRHDHFNKYLSA